MQVPDSERLSYALLSDADEENLFQLDQDPAVMRYINDGHVTTREDMLATFLPRLNAYRNPEKGWGLWGVTVLDSHEFVGWILVRPMHFFTERRDDDDLELGWRFRQAAWGKGYATEAATAVRNAVQTAAPVRAFSAVALAENHASIKVMKKLGMRLVKTETEQVGSADRACVYYTMLADCGD